RSARRSCRACSGCGCRRPPPTAPAPRSPPWPFTSSWRPCSPFDRKACLVPVLRSRQFAFMVVLPIALALVPLLASAVGNMYLVTLVNHALIYALAAMALDFIMGYGRLVSFGHAAFFGLGAYTVGILSTHFMQGMPLLFGWVGSNEALLVWPLAMLVSGLYALFVGLISLRTSGIYFIMITLAFSQLVYYFFVSLSAYGGMTGLSIWLRNTV